MEHVASPPKVSKVIEILGKGKKASPNWLLIRMPQKHALLTDETATTSGEEHVLSPPKVSKIKEISRKVKKDAPKQVAKKV